ncbi:MAG TPA: hypothetical protein VIU63_10455 [Nitrospira sp.]
MAKRVFLFWGLTCVILLSGIVQADASSILLEFSGSIVKKINGKRYQAQIYCKGSLLRLEYQYAIRTERGFSSIEIVRPDDAEVWYLLAQQKELLVIPLEADDVLPTRPELPGERDRILVGESSVAGRQAKLYEIQSDHGGRRERFYEWVDAEAEIVLKLVSRDRDWSFEYERIRLSRQPAYYFDAPPGYTRREVSGNGRRKG